MTNTGNDVALDGRSEAVFSSYAQNFGTPFNFIARTTVVVDSGSRRPQREGRRHRDRSGVGQAEPCSRRRSAVCDVARSPAPGRPGWPPRWRWRPARPGWPARIVCLDRARFPRAKPCGGGLTGHARAALRRAGAGGARPARRLRGRARLIYGGGERRRRAGAAGRHRPARGASTPIWWRRRARAGSRSSKGRGSSRSPSTRPPAWCSVTTRPGARCARGCWSAPTARGAACASG